MVLGLNEMRFKKPCKRCGSLERYKNGACKPCAIAKQAIRNEEDRMPAQYELAKQKERSKQAREEARSQNLTHFDSQSPCYICQGTIRFVSNGGCIACVNRDNLKN